MSKKQLISLSKLIKNYYYVFTTYLYLHILKLVTEFLNFLERFYLYVFNILLGRFIGCINRVLLPIILGRFLPC